MSIKRLSTLMHVCVMGSTFEVVYESGEIRHILYDGILTKLTIPAILLQDNIISMRILDDDEGGTTQVGEDVIIEFKKNYSDTIKVIQQVNNLINFRDFSMKSLDYAVISSKCSFNKDKTVNNDAFVIINSTVKNNRVCMFFLDKKDNTVLVVNKHKAYIANFNNVFNID